MVTNREEGLKSIAKRLQRSDGALWSSLTKEERDTVLETYYDSLSLNALGLTRILENNVSLRQNFGMLILGLLFGIFGSAVASIILKYLPQQDWRIDIAIGVVFVAFMLWFFRETNKALAEHLAEEDVLGFLVKEARKKHSETAGGDQPVGDEPVI